MIRANYHTHTVFCDGKNTAEEMAEAAASLGMTHLGFSGHMDRDIHMDWNQYTGEIQRLRKLYEGRMEILMGVELDTLYDPAMCPGAEYRIGSTHYMDLDITDSTEIDLSPEVTRNLLMKYYDGDFRKMARAYYELEATTGERTQCTFVGHFDLIVRFNDVDPLFDESDSLYRRYALEAMEHLVWQGLPFEVNCGAYNRGRKKELYPAMPLLQALHDMGGRILINSDAHDRDHLLGGFEEAEKRALSCGFREALILVRREGKVQFREVPLCGT